MNRSISCLCLSILSDTQVECPISIHPSPNKNSKVNSTALSFLRASLSNRRIQHNGLRVQLNKFSSYYTLNRAISHSWLSGCFRRRTNISEEWDNTSFFIATERYISWKMNTPWFDFPWHEQSNTYHHCVMIQHEEKNLISPRETYSGSLVTYRLLCHYERTYVQTPERDDCVIDTISTGENEQRNA